MKTKNGVILPSKKTTTKIIIGAILAICNLSGYYSILFCINCLFYISLVLYHYRKTGIWNFDQPFGFPSFLFKKIKELLDEDESITPIDFDY